MGWFTDLKISVKLMLSYLVLCIMLVFVGVMGIIGLNSIKENVNSMYYDSMMGLANISESRANIEGVQVYVQRLIMPEYRNRISSLEEEINKKTATNSTALKGYESAMTNPEDKAMFQELQKLLAVYRDKRVMTVDLVKRGDYEAARAAYYDQLSPATDTVVAYINKMSAWNNEVGKSYIKDAEDNYDAIMKTMITIVVVGVIAAIILGFFIARSIANPLNSLVYISDEVAAGKLSHNIVVNRKDEIGKLENSIKTMITNLRNVIINVQNNANNVAASSEELTASADQSSQAANNVATSIMEVAQGAEKQLAIVGKTVSTAERMSAEAEQIAANTNIVSSTSEKTAQSAERGRKAVETAINQMASIQNTVENLAREITGLGMRSQEIGQIVETISGIAGQTNLLALNAAIEAARAGEQGRGFAVVAEEVRKLAEQSQEAAKQISTLIGGIQNDTSKAVQAMEAGTREVKTGAELVDNAGIAFKEIVGLIDQTSSQVQEISEAINHMAIASQEIVAGAQEINVVSEATSSETQTVSSATQEQLASMQEIASASQALAKRAEELQAVVQKFVI